MALVPAGVQARRSALSCGFEMRRELPLIGFTETRPPRARIPPQAPTRQLAVEVDDDVALEAPPLPTKPPVAPVLPGVVPPEVVPPAEMFELLEPPSPSDVVPPAWGADCVEPGDPEAASPPLAPVVVCRWVTPPEWLAPPFPAVLLPEVVAPAVPSSTETVRSAT